MRILKNKLFDQWAQKLRITDSILVEAVNDLEKRLYEANLGGHIYKKRIAVGSKGKSSGVRTIVAFKFNDKAFFIYGFAKNKKSNISKKEEEGLKALAKFYFSLNEKQINHSVKEGKLVEVKYEKINS